MITEEMVQRINELAQKKKNQGLTPVEQAEQKELYKIYLAAIRKNVTTQLDAAEIISEGHVCDDNCHHHDPDCNHDKH